MTFSKNAKTLCIRGALCSVLNRLRVKSSKDITTGLSNRVYKRL